MVQPGLSDGSGDVVNDPDEVADDGGGSDGGGSSGGSDDGPDIDTGIGGGVTGGGLDPGGGGGTGDDTGGSGDPDPEEEDFDTTDEATGGGGTGSGVTGGATGGGLDPGGGGGTGDDTGGSGDPDPEEEDFDTTDEAMGSGTPTSPLQEGGGSPGVTPSERRDLADTDAEDGGSSGSGVGRPSTPADSRLYSAAGSVGEQQSETDRITTDQLGGVYGSEQERRRAERIASRRDDVELQDIARVRRTQISELDDMSPEDVEGADSASDEVLVPTYAEYYQEERARQQIVQGTDIEESEIERVEETDDGWRPILTDEAETERVKEQALDRDPRRMFAGTEQIPVGVDEDDIEVSETDDGYSVSYTDDYYRAQLASENEQVDPDDVELIREDGEVVGARATTAATDEQSGGGGFLDGFNVDFEANPEQLLRSDREQPVIEADVSAPSPDIDLGDGVSLSDRRAQLDSALGIAGAVAENPSAFQTVGEEATPTLDPNQIGAGDFVPARVEALAGLAGAAVENPDAARGAASTATGIDGPSDVVPVEVDAATTVGEFAARNPDAAQQVGTATAGEAASDTATAVGDAQTQTARVASDVSERVAANIRTADASDAIPVRARAALGVAEAGVENPDVGRGAASTATGIDGPSDVVPVEAGAAATLGGFAARNPDAAQQVGEAATPTYSIPDIGVRDVAPAEAELAVGLVGGAVENPAATRRVGGVVGGDIESAIDAEAAEVEAGYPEGTPEQTRALDEDELVAGAAVGGARRPAGGVTGVLVRRSPVGAAPRQGARIAGRAAAATGIAGGAAFAADQFSDEVDQGRSPDEIEELEVSEQLASELDVALPQQAISELEPADVVSSTEFEPGEPRETVSELTVGTGETEADDTVPADDTVVPGDYPLAGRDIPRNPSRDRPERIDRRDLVDTGARTAPVFGEGTAREQEREDDSLSELLEEFERAQQRRRRERAQAREEQLWSPSQSRSRRDATRDRTRRRIQEWWEQRDNWVNERVFPTGAGAVVGFEGVGAGASLSEATEPELSDDVGTREGVRSGERTDPRTAAAEAQDDATRTQLSQDLLPGQDTALEQGVQMETEAVQPTVTETETVFEPLTESVAVEGYGFNYSNPLETATPRSPLPTDTQPDGWQERPQWGASDAVYGSGLGDLDDILNPDEDLFSDGFGG